MSYDNDSPNWVYFDDFKVTHTTTNVIQYNEYYPFGLRTENSWTREDHSNKFLYNAGAELNANTGRYETFFMGYDAALGRFMQVDPLASVSSSYSPYHYAYNNPVLFNDPLGDRPEEVMRDLEKYGGGGHSYQMYDYSDSWGQGFGNNQYGQHFVSGSQYYGGMMSATAFYQKAMSGHGGYWENGKATMYQYDREAEKYFDFEQYTHAIDHGEGWYGVDNGINVNRYEWIVGIKSTKKGQQEGPRDTNFIVDNNSRIGLAISILEPSISGGANDAARLGTFTKGAVSTAKGLGYGLTGVNVGLTAYTITSEVKNGSFNTHSIVNGFVTTVGVGLTVTGAAITSPVWGTGLLIGGAVLGVGYGISQVAGFDSWIDNKTNNWGKELIK